MNTISQKTEQCISNYLMTKNSVMNKYLLTIEFRYHVAPKGNYDSDSKSKKITIGVYDEFNEACIHGNKQLEILESLFDLHVFPSGIAANRERFSKNGGAYGSKKNLITDMAYLKTPFRFFAKIITLEYDNIESVVNGVLDSIKEYKTYQRSQLD